MVVRAEQLAFRRAPGKVVDLILLQISLVSRKDGI